MAGKFEVYQDKAGKYRFRLKASNGQVIATGEAYESKVGGDPLGCGHQLGQVAHCPGQSSPGPIVESGGA